MFKAALINGNTTKNAARYEIRKQVQKVEPHDEKLAVSYLDLENKTHNTVYADFVIASDGAHSTVRSMLAPVPSPQYAGYVSWRGRVPEKEVSKETLAALQNRVVMYRHRGGYIVS
jgi:2-polyprenyl-6-methoxyphenol hydroxylase-like FAD-dependent oxidoreductase